MTSALVGLCLWLSQATPAPENLLNQVRQKMADNLARLPNYTCGLTVERSARLSASRRFQDLDTLRLEVSFVGGKELFAWPGAEKFEEKPIHEMVGGTVSTGSFALHARAIFLRKGPSFTYMGEEEGKLRFDFRVPLAASQYVITTTRQALVAYHGSFWADAKTFDLVRLQVHVPEAPADTGVKQAEELMEYRITRIGDADFLLPASSDLVMTDVNGAEHRNRTRFSACRQYAGESVISFAEAPVETPVPARAATPLELPAGLDVEMALEGPLESAKLAIGDPARAVAVRDVKKDGIVVLPKGARFTGRITRIEKRQQSFEYLVVGVCLERVEFEGRRGAFHAKLQSAGVSDRYFVPFADGVGGPLTIFNNLRQAPFLMPKPDEGVFLMRGGHQRIPERVRLMWQTVSAGEQ